jgi:drug/metabolite transporter (DMT)-like permease
MALADVRMTTSIASAPAAAVSSTEWRGYAFGVSAALIWGLYLALSRQGVSSGLTPIDITVFRYVTAGLVMLPYAILNWQSLAAIGLKRGVVLALLAGPPFILLGVGGYLFAPLAHGAVIQPAMVTVLSMILASVFLGDKPNRARIVGVATILMGVVTIAGPGLLKGGALTPLGDAMFALAGLCWALFTLQTRRWQVLPVAGTAMVVILSGLVMAPVAIFHVGLDHYLAQPASVLAAQIGVQGVLTGVISVIAYSTAVKLIGPAKAAIFPALVPASAIIVGVPIVGEWPTALQLAGLALVSIGLLIAIGVLKVPSRRAALG